MGIMGKGNLKMGQMMSNNHATKNKRIGARHRAIPLRWLLTELDELAIQFRYFYTPRNGYPGLQSAGRRLPKDLDFQLLALREKIIETQKDYVELLTYEKNPSAQMTEGEELLDEIVTALEWYATSTQEETTEDDDNEDGNEDGADNITGNEIPRKDVEDEDVDTPEKMARALFDYATIASEIRNELDGIGGFDTDTIDRAFKVVNNLVDVKTKLVPLTDEAQALLNKRAYYIRRAIAKTELLRSAASLVFRRYPEVIKKFSSHQVPIQNAADYRVNKISRVYQRHLNRRNIPMRFLPSSPSM